MQKIPDKPRHEHQHAPNRFAVIPTLTRLDADPHYTGKGVTIAFLDSGFFPHPDLVEPVSRIVAYKDLADENASLEGAVAESWQWHGTQTSVVAAGNGRLCEGIYRGLACNAQLVLVKVSDRGRITEENIVRGLHWVIENRERYNIRVLNISLGGDEDVPCSLSLIDQAAEEAVRQGIAVVVAAGNAGAEGKHSIPPANSPSVITVGGYHDNNQLDRNRLDLYQSNFGFTADGSVKPEIIAPAMWVAAPILPNTSVYVKAEALSKLAASPEYLLTKLVRELGSVSGLPASLQQADPVAIREYVESSLNQNKFIAAHYQHVDGTSFAAPIVASLIAQMIESNPKLTPGAVKSILISTADRIADAPAVRQGFGVVNARRALAMAATEQHPLNNVGCGPPRIAEGKLLFVFHDDYADSVSLAGDFNEWDPARSPLVRDPSGMWEVAIAAPTRGRYQYKLLVDGVRWVEDPSNGMKVADNYGGLNSLLVIE